MKFRIKINPMLVGAHSDLRTSSMSKILSMNKWQNSTKWEEIFQKWRKKKLPPNKNKSPLWRRNSKKSLPMSKERQFRSNLGFQCLANAWLELSRIAKKCSRCSTTWVAMVDRNSNRSTLTSTWPKLSPGSASASARSRSSAKYSKGQTVKI